MIFEDFHGAYLRLPAHLTAAVRPGRQRAEASAHSRVRHQSGLCRRTCPTDESSGRSAPELNDVLTDDNERSQVQFQVYTDDTPNVVWWLQSVELDDSTPEEKVLLIE